MIFFSRLAAALLIVLASVSCTAQTTVGRGTFTPTRTLTPTSVETTPSTSSAPTSGRLVRVWSSHGFAPVSPVRMIDGVAVGYGARDGQLLIYGLDAHTGRTLWQHAASTGDETDGVPVYVSRIEDDVAYYGTYTDRSSRSAKMILVHASTGKVVATSPSMVWTGPPYPCRVQPNAPCAVRRPTHPTYYDAGDEYRLNPDTRQTNPNGTEIAGGHPLGAGLYDTEQYPERIARQDVAQKIVWSRRSSALFGAGYSPDYGWDIQRLKDIYVGAFRSLCTFSADRRTCTRDLATTWSTAGFRVSDGHLLWRNIGASFTCWGAVWDDAAPVRCRARGKEILQLAPDHDTIVSSSLRDLDIVMEGFDPRTGRTRWHRDLGADRRLYEDGVGDGAEHEIVTTGPDGPLVIDLRTGAAHRPSPHATFWCERYRSFRATPEGRRIDAVRGGVITTACTATGARTSRLPATIDDGDATGPDGLRLLAGVDAVSAYRIE